MLNKIKKNNSGFTIIEVLIVLAIAGLILLVVFLAVPALQRNQRNAGYRSEANRVLGAAQEVSANNGGSKLALSACGTAAPICTDTAVTTDAAKVFRASNAKNVTFLKIADGSAAAPGGVAPSVPATGVAGTVTEQVSLVGATIFTGAKCLGQSSYTAGTTRQTVLMYAVEDNTGNVVVQCQES